MTTGMPELGSKISLISKADIRYEGRLYTVDPQECTIALSSVRSFGTEDRDTQYQIAPQSQIYDYILFRGSDIKDIRVVNSLPHPNDPAIMQVQLPSGQHLMPHFPMSGMNPSHAGAGGAPGFTHPFGAMGGLSNLGNNSSAASVVAAASLAAGSGAGGNFMMNNNQHQSQPQLMHQKPQAVQQPKQPMSVTDMLVGASRSTTPISLISRKSPSADIALQQQQQQQQQQHQQQQQQIHQQQQQQQQQQHLNQKHPNNAQLDNMRDAGHKRQNHQQQRGGGNRNDFYNYQQQHHNNNRGPDNYMQNNDGRYNYNPRNYPNQNRNWNMHRGVVNNMNANMRNRGNNGRGRVPNQGFRQIGLAVNHNKQRSKTTIKFEQDFDFEQANNKFEELRSQISKLKVSEDPKAEQLNSETDKKDDSGNETGAGEHEHEEDEITVGYDKAKSFFDNISCEAVQDRSKNKKNDWRQERKLNSETFGISSTRRESFRGRANFYNNRNIMGGNYNRGYRSIYRNRVTNRTGNPNVNNRENNQNANGTINPVVGGIPASTEAKNMHAAVTTNSAAIMSTASTAKTTQMQENIPSSATGQ